jgi:heme exporter protein C
MRLSAWRRVGAAGLLAVMAASYFMATAASRSFYGVDHPVNLIFYYHFAVAWVGFAGLLLAAIASAAYLTTRRLGFSWAAEGAIVVSFAFLSLTLATGMVWGRFIWNSWWEWSDLRLVTALVVWFMYAGYLMFRLQSSDAGSHAKAAVFSLLAFVSVPVTVASSRLWQSPFHGTSLGTESVAIHVPAFALALLGTGLVYPYLVALRWQTHALEHALDEALDDALGDAVAGRSAGASQAWPS